MAGAPQKVSDYDILEALTEVAHPVGSTSEISERVPVIQKTVEKRLNDLYDRGLIDRKKIGTAYAWWLTNRGESYLKDNEIQEEQVE